MIEQEKKTLICLILEALKKQGSWCGETHIQKAAYLAKEMFKIPLEEYDFFLYRYGPYSSEISVDLATMRNEEIIVRTATYPFGATYGVKENKEIPSEDMEECRKQYGKKIDFIAEKFSDKGVGYLERLCTAHWVIRNYTNKTTDELAETLSEIKVKIPLETALKTIEETNSMIRKADKIA